MIRIFGSANLSMLLIISVCCLLYKKPIWEIVSSVAAMALTYMTGCSWKEMLAESGKDTAWLGFNRYPAALSILAVLLLTAFVLMIVGIIGAARQHKNKG